MVLAVTGVIGPVLRAREDRILRPLQRINDFSVKKVSTQAISAIFGPLKSVFSNKVII
jgi:hypothetical protein